MAIQARLNNLSFEGLQVAMAEPSGNLPPALGLARKRLVPAASRMEGCVKAWLPSLAADLEAESPSPVKKTKKRPAAPTTNAISKHQALVAADGTPVVNKKKRVRFAEDPPSPPEAAS
eukprot:Protomagalhaensia_sp_Gyna_25__6110@NODE_98_length_5286_cov_144_613303_g75_i0_p3_GENE_NODE_98_length_5286_cov_144_613303_g75_i0NODE_98_length_5286_cov_144_613303_g75_i0_p3_ORF_typecomplete_len118_score23_70_NODE_98_length_5286_cov_144_613303_g75_i097450